jgi:hypothetical protein
MKLPESSFTFESDIAVLYFVANNALLKSIKIFLFMPINSQNNKPALSMCIYTLSNYGLIYIEN